MKYEKEHQEHKGKIDKCNRIMMKSRRKRKKKANDLRERLSDRAGEKAKRE